MELSSNSKKYSPVREQVRQVRWERLKTQRIFSQTLYKIGDFYFYWFCFHCWYTRNNKLVIIIIKLNAYLYIFVIIKGKFKSAEIHHLEMHRWIRSSAAEKHRMAVHCKVLHRGQCESWGQMWWLVEELEQQCLQSVWR